MPCNFLGEVLLNVGKLEPHAGKKIQQLSTIRAGSTMPVDVEITGKLTLILQYLTADVLARHSNAKDSTYSIRSKRNKQEILQLLLLKAEQEELQKSQWLNKAKLYSQDVEASAAAVEASERDIRRRALEDERLRIQQEKEEERRAEQMEGHARRERERQREREEEEEHARRERERQREREEAEEHSRREQEESWKVEDAREEEEKACQQRAHQLQQVHAEKQRQEVISADMLYWLLTCFMGWAADMLYWLLTCFTSC